MAATPNGEKVATLEHVPASELTEGCECGHGQYHHYFANAWLSRFGKCFVDGCTCERFMRGLVSPHGSTEASQ